MTKENVHINFLFSQHPREDFPLPVSCVNQDIFQNFLTLSKVHSC